MTSVNQTPKDTEPPRPPQPPRIKRELRKNPKRLISIVPMLVVVALALAGWLGERTETRVTQNESLALKVEYPKVLRFSQYGRVKVTVSNNGDQPTAPAVITFDQAFFSRFSDMRFVPAEQYPLQVPIGGLEPGTTRLLVVDLKADKRGANSGWISLSIGNAEVLRATLSTTILP